MSTSPALSFVIPLYRSAETIEAVVHAIEACEVEGGIEIVLVNDGSPDETDLICGRLIDTARVPIIYVEHSRNFGEHNAVLTGYRYTRGEYVVNLDDDGQNPPAEGVRMYEYARQTGLDAVFGDYRTKQHEAWRNWGSRFTNWVADLMLDKPKGLYLSSFRCVSGLVAQEAAGYTGPFPYIDGLILQMTQRVGALKVEHKAREAGQSGYTVRRLVRLWLNSVVNFSIVPLRVATVLGGITGGLGILGLAVVAYLRLMHLGPAFGWGSLMATLLIFSGTQLLVLGAVGEYIGRAFLVVSGRPQSVVRKVATTIAGDESMRDRG